MTAAALRAAPAGHERPQAVAEGVAPPVDGHPLVPARAAVARVALDGGRLLLPQRGRVGARAAPAGRRG